MSSGEVTFFPTVRLFGQFSFRIVNVDGDFRALDFGPQPEPVLIAFEQLLSHGFLFARAEVAAPIIFANLETFLDVRLGRLQREGLCVIDCAGSAARQRNETSTQSIIRKLIFVNRFIRGFLTRASQSRYPACS